MTDTDKQNKQSSTVKANHNIASMLDATPTYLPTVRDKKAIEDKMSKNNFLTISFITFAMLFATILAIHSYIGATNSNVFICYIERLLLFIIFFVDAYFIKEWFRVFLNRKK